MQKKKKKKSTPKKALVSAKPSKPKKPAKAGKAAASKKAAAAAKPMTSKKPKKPKKSKKGLDPHPFEYFRLTNNTPKPIKLATIKATVGPDGHGGQLPILGSGEVLAPGDSTEVEFEVDMNWDHVRTVRLNVVFTDDSKDAQVWSGIPLCLKHVDMSAAAPQYEVYPVAD